MDFKAMMNMDPEEMKMHMLDSMSDAVRALCKHLALLKAVAYRQEAVSPEDFDKAFERTYSREWDEVKDKTMDQLALIMLLEMATKGEDVDALFEEVKIDGEEDS